jgi:hypothetical protein
MLIAAEQALKITSFRLWNMKEVWAAARAWQGNEALGRSIVTLMQMFCHLVPNCRTNIRRPGADVCLKHCHTAENK